MQVTRYPLTDANAALADLRAGRFEGAAVLIPKSKTRCGAPLRGAPQNPKPLDTQRSA